MESLQKCPKCLGNDMKFIAKVPIEGTNKVRILYECCKFNEYFWGDNGEKEEYLADFCKTRWDKPEKCNDKIRNLFTLDYDKFGRPIPKTTPEKLKEIDKICGECPNKNFIISK